MCDQNLYTSAEFEIERLRPVMEFMTQQERMEVELYSLLCGVRMKRANVDALFSYLQEHPISDAIILLKGSRSNQMEKALPLL